MANRSTGCSNSVASSPRSRKALPELLGRHVMGCRQPTWVASYSQ